MLATAIIIKCGCWDDLALGMVSGILVVAEKAFQCRWLMTDYAYQLICSMGIQFPRQSYSCQSRVYTFMGR